MTSLDVILMDLQMPVCDGYSATLKIRENSAFNDLPIVAMTANAASDVQARCLEVGMNDFLTKPFIIEDLLQMISIHYSSPVSDQKSNFAVHGNCPLQSTVLTCRVSTLITLKDVCFHSSLLQIPHRILCSSCRHLAL